MDKNQFENMIITPESTFIYKNKEYGVDTYDKEKGVLYLYDTYEVEEPPKEVSYKDVEIGVNVRFKKL